MLLHRTTERDSSQASSLETSPMGNLHTCSPFCHSLHHPALPPIPPPAPAARPSKPELAEHGWPACGFTSASFCSLQRLPVCSRETELRSLGRWEFLSIQLTCCVGHKWQNKVQNQTPAVLLEKRVSRELSGPVATRDIHTNAKQVGKCCCAGDCSRAPGCSLLQVPVMTRGFYKPGLPCWSSISTPTTLPSPPETWEGKHHLLF